MCVCVQCILGIPGLGHVLAIFLFLAGDQFCISDLRLSGGPLDSAHGPGNEAANFSVQHREDRRMPFSTPAEQRAVWDTIGSSKSFLQAVEMPKLGRWFSWNGSAKLQLKEYHTTKMLLESYLEDAPDPSDGPIEFDDLRAAATARTPAEQLARLKSASGSIDGSSGSSCLDGLGYLSVLVFGSPGCSHDGNP